MALLVMNLQEVLEVVVEQEALEAAVLEELVVFVVDLVQLEQLTLAVAVAVELILVVML